MFLVNQFEEFKLQQMDIFLTTSQLACPPPIYWVHTEIRLRYCQMHLVWNCTKLHLQLMSTKSPLANQHHRQLDNTLSQILNPHVVTLTP